MDSMDNMDIMDRDRIRGIGTKPLTDYQLSIINDAKRGQARKCGIPAASQPKITENEKRKTIQNYQLSMINYQFKRGVGMTQQQSREIPGQVMDTNAGRDIYMAAASQRTKEKNYWLEKLSGDPVKSIFPYDNERSNSRIIEKITFTIDSNLFSRLTALSTGSDHRLHMILTAGVMVLLARYTHKNDIILAAPVVRQQGTISVINTVVPLRLNLDDSFTFKDLLLKVRQTVMEAAENQNYPVQVLPSQLGMTETPDDFPLFDIAVLLENLHKPGDLCHIPFNMIFSFKRIEQGIEGQIQYNSGRYEHETIRRIIANWLHTMNRLVFNVDAPLSGIQPIAPAELHQLLHEFNDTTRPYPFDKTVPGMFELQTAASPDTVAVIYKEQTYTYRQLESLSGRLARLLRQRGAGPGKIAAILFDWCAELVMAFMAALRSGSAYLPLDPRYPTQRIKTILNDSNASFFITSRELAADYPEFDSITLCIEDFLQSIDKTDWDLPSSFETDLDPHDPAYIIYTSGSTGTPKGIIIEHHSFIDFTAWAVDEFEHRPGYKVLLSNSFASDGAIQQIFPPLISGGTLHLLDPQVRLDPAAYYTYLKENRINYIDEVPVVMNLLFDHLPLNENIELLPDLSLIALGGEYIPIDVARKSRQYLLHSGKIINAYGPAEASVDCTVYHFDGKSDSEISSIGKPRQNLQVYILDSQERICPIGVPGEICIAGTGVARGYLNRVSLTAERFSHLFEKRWGQKFLFDFNSSIQKGGSLQKGDSQETPRRGDLLWRQAPSGGFLNGQPLRTASLQNNINKSFCGGPGGDFHEKSPLAAGGTLYHTGDLGRWRADGNIEFLGRVDHQVSIRGYRVELGEIENQLMQSGAISDAVVLPREDRNKGKTLCAYYVPVPVSSLSITQLREFLSQRLPDYMIPAYFIRMERIPLTPNGKIDRKALEAIDIDLESNAGFTPPTDAIETKLVELWSDVLDAPKEKIGIDADIFTLGANSLHSVILTNLIYKEFNVKVPLVKIFKLSNIRGLAQFITGLKKEIFQTIDKALEKPYYDLSPAQKRLFFVQHIDEESPAYNLNRARELVGPLDLKKIETTFKQLIQRHEGLRTSFEIVDGNPVQRIHPHVDFSISYWECPDPKPLHIFEEFYLAFDLGQAPLFRIGIVKTGENRHLMLSCLHHIIADGNSTDILVEEFKILYNGKELKPLKLQYKDFSEWQNRVIRSGVLKAQESYWMEQFKDGIPTLDVPLDFPRPRKMNFEGRQTGFYIPPGTMEQLLFLAGTEKVTPYILFFTLFNVLMFKLSGQEDIVVGTDTAGRRHADLDNIFGMFVNTMAIRTFPKPGTSFLQFLAETKDRVLAAFDNQDWQFDDLVDRLLEKRDPGRNPIFDVMYSYYDIDKNEEIPGLEIKPITLEHTDAHFDLILIVQAGNPFIFTFEYNIHLFKPQTIDAFIRYYLRSIDSVLENPAQTLAEIDILDPEEKERLLEKYKYKDENETENENKNDSPLRQARQNPAQMVVDFDF